MLSVFFPGYLELLIFALASGFVLVPLAVVYIVIYIARQGRSKQSNLHPCVDCGNMISPNAKSCPRCGCPTNKPS
jgi:uncharacterized paraquat-inducible protein A